MSEIGWIIVMTVLIMVVNWTMYQWGVYSEREKWNQLIETGRLPRPRMPRPQDKE